MNALPLSHTLLTVVTSDPSNLGPPCFIDPLVHPYIRQNACTCNKAYRLATSRFVHQDPELEHNNTNQMTPSLLSLYRKSEHKATARYGTACRSVTAVSKLTLLPGRSVLVRALPELGARPVQQLEPVPPGTSRLGVRRSRSQVR